MKTTICMRVFRLSQRCGWGFRSAGMWLRVTG